MVVSYRFPVAIRAAIGVIIQTSCYCAIILGKTVLDTPNLLGLSDSHVVEISGEVKTGSEAGIYLHSELVPHYMELKRAAAKEGFDLCVASGFRSFERQRLIWNAKASGERTLLNSDGVPLVASSLSDEAKMWAILRWSALPGASRHHWGTDFDIYDAAALPKGRSLELTVEETEPKGVFGEMYRWLEGYLSSHTPFYRPYELDLYGVAPEPWHLSYAPLASEYIHLLTESRLRTYLASTNLALKELVLDHLGEIVSRFIVNVK